MDSISQMALGGSIAYLVAGKQAPRLALLAGVVVATLPDLDVIVQYADPLQSTIKHRTWSHSWLVQTAIAPLLAYAVSLYLPKLDYQRWFWLIWLCLITHTMLDCFTVYGTAALWPLPLPNIMQGSIFIIDPLYTLPLLIASVVAWRRQNATQWIVAGLMMSGVYMAWGLGAQQNIKQRLSHQLAKQNIIAKQMLVTPTPFNSLLWRVVAVREDSYFEGFASVLDDDKAIKLTQFASDEQHLEPLKKLPSFKDYAAFSHGFYALENRDGAIIIKDLRMGLSPHLLFQFKIAHQVVDKIIATPPQFTGVVSLPIDELKMISRGLLGRIFNQPPD